MRLLSTATLTLHEFFGSSIPPYSILSHRWEDDEVSFHDVQNRQNCEAYGWSKVRNASKFANSRKADYIWIDTCCIDRTSSAELTEAINSMFAWYQGAFECYAYLKDVPSGLDAAAKADVLQQSEWFTRGWTLQELLAPSKILFICADWTESLGSREDFSIAINLASGIEPADFDAVHRNKVSIARRMSWAARRSCTRMEDEAYSLMGLFGVNMPLLYGEGDKAFLRLQTEILKVSDDESLFAWWIPQTNLQNQSGTGLLARSPSDFAHSADAMPRMWDADARAYSMTNKGLQMEPKLLFLRTWASVEQSMIDLDGRSHPVRFTDWQRQHLYGMLLNCSIRAEGSLDDAGKMIAHSDRTPVLIILRRIIGSTNTYCRLFASEKSMTIMPKFDKEFVEQRRTIYVRPPPAGIPWPDIEIAEVESRAVLRSR